jgi:hypothetical protein
MKTVAVFGAGISGLSAAHELVKKGYEVSVYEKLLEPGGMARSYRQTPETAPSEYSWRAYGSFYYNVFDIMKKIPVGNDGKTVYDNLSRPMNSVFTKNRGSFLNGLSWSDKIVLGVEIIRVVIAGAKRTAYYASINAVDYLKPKMSHRGWEQFKSMIGPLAGIDPKRSSLFHIIFFVAIHILPDSQPSYLHYDEDGEWNVKISDWSVFNKPTSEAWFDPWVKHLKNMGVKFHLGYKLHSVQPDNNKICSGNLPKVRPQKITSVKVMDNYGNLTTVVSDHYIMAISPFGMGDVLKKSISSIKKESSRNIVSIENSKLYNLTKMTKQFLNLTQDGPQIQVSFRIGFNKEDLWPVGNRESLILSDTKFNLTMYSQDELWDNNVYLGPNIVSLWSGTACVSYIPGPLFGKSVVDLTRDQFKQEVLHQMSKDEGFNDILQKSTGGSFSKLLPYIIHFEIWKSWKFVGDDLFHEYGDDIPHELKEDMDETGKLKHITIIEPKYVDSTNTRPHQPDTTTDISNLWMAGGHTRTSTNIWSMEAAAEAGRKAADKITGGNSTIEHDKGIVLRSMGKVDDVLYDRGMPNVVDILLIFIIMMFICIVSWYMIRGKL